jgi:hypothetical protein
MLKLRLWFQCRSSRKNLGSPALEAERASRSLRQGCEPILVLVETAFDSSTWHKSSICAPVPTQRIQSCSQKVNVIILFCDGKRMNPYPLGRRWSVDGSGPPADHLRSGMVVFGDHQPSPVRSPSSALNMHSSIGRTSSDATLKRDGITTFAV